MPPLYLRIKHLGATHDFVLAEGAAATTLGDLKNAIYDKLKVPPSKQRLLITRGGGKLLKLDSAALSQHLPPDQLSSVPLAADAAPVFMLIGNPEIPVTSEVVSGSATPSLSYVACESNLVCIPRERRREREPQPQGVHACSYSAGYVPQDAHYCRTCANAGFADPQHFFCSGCAEVCHAGHETEHWGLHTFLRCDCCTSTCCHPPQQSTTFFVPDSPASSKSIETEITSLVVQPRRCHFVVNITTEKIPATPLSPNLLNRYPTEAERVCLCNDTEDEADLSCLLCYNRFCFSHMTRLHTDMFLTVPCCAETSGFNKLGYRCNTCGGDDVFCPPCIVHCHQGHDIDKKFVVLEHQSHHPNQRELKFACGSGAKGGSASGASVVSCPISHDTQLTRLMDLGARPGLVAGVSNGLVPQWMARQLVDDNQVCDFVCASCMITHPWLWNTDAQFGSTDHAAGVVGSQDLTALRRCWKGQLPTAPRPSPSSLSTTVVACHMSASNLNTPLTGSSPLTSAFSSNAPSALEFTSAAPFPYHGMLIAEEFFRFLCQCSDCQAAFAKISPRNQGAPRQQLFMKYEDDICTMCGVVIEQDGSLCLTCELAGFAGLLCATCANSLELREFHRVASDVGEGVFHRIVSDPFEELRELFGGQLKRNVIDQEAKASILKMWYEGAARESLLGFFRQNAFGARAVVVAPAQSIAPLAEQPGTTNTDTTEGGDDEASSKKRPRDDERRT